MAKKELNAYVVGKMPFVMQVSEVTLGFIAS